MLFEEVERLINKYDEKKEYVRFELLKGARSIVLSSAESGSKKSMMFATPDQLSEVEWLKKEFRNEGVSTSVQGEMLHFNVTGPRARREYRPRRNETDPNHPSHSY